MKNENKKKNSKLSKLMSCIRKPSKLIIYLMKKKFFWFLNDKTYIKLLYKLEMGKKLDLNNPKTFNEKIQWLKLYDRKNIYTTMVDKYLVKDYVTNIIGNKYIIPTLGVYDEFDDIDFSKLPNQFVIKSNNDSGGIVICKDKKNLDLIKTKKIINDSLHKNYYYNCREWPYKNIKPKIIIEEYLYDKKGEDLKDYKIQCFNGIPKYIQVDFDRFTDHHRNIYDSNWNYVDLEIKYPTNKEKIIEKPKKLEEMLDIAKKLSKNIPYVRIDLYFVNNQIYFGEITFYHGGGYEHFTPSSDDLKWGNLIKLDNLKISQK